MSTKRERTAAAKALGSKGGKAGTEAQNKARASNGAKGGRPVYRLCFTCEARVRLERTAARGVYTLAEHDTPAGAKCRASGHTTDLREG